MGFAKAMVIGNLGRDPEMRYTPNGLPVTEFSVAVNQSTKNQQTGEWDEATDWYRVTVFGDKAERHAEQLRKGMRVFVEGRFRPREYTARDNTNRTSLEITATDVVNLTPKEQDDGNGYQQAAPVQQSRQGAPVDTRGPGDPSWQRGPAQQQRPQAQQQGRGYRDDDLDDLPF